MKKSLIVFGFMLSSAILVGQSRSNYTSQGRYELSRGRYASAIKLLNKSVELNEFNSEAYFLRGISKYELEDFIGAEKDLGKAIELNPKNHEALLYRGVCRSQQLKYKEAFDDYNKAIRLNDEDWRVYSNRALASLQLDRFVDVISDCNKIIALKKDNSYTYLVRGEAKSGLEMYRVAIEDFERAIKRDSSNMRPILHRGIARAKIEDYIGAIEDFEKAMELDSTNALPIFHRGVALVETGKYQLALADFNEVLNKHSNNAVVLFNRAMTYTDMKKWDKAMADYDQVIKLSPKSILGYYNRGNLRFNRKKYSAALKDYNKAVELFPEFIDAQERRSEVFRILKDKKSFDAAVAELNRIRTLISVSDEEARFKQHVKLLKVTELKGDFEPIPQEVGKVQHQKVDVRLLPFYRISIFPETDKNISVYDGFNRPYYNTGAIAFTTIKKTRNEDVVRLLSQLENSPPKNPAEIIRAATAQNLVGNKHNAHQLLNACLEADAKQAACYFARASLFQIELELLIDSMDAVIGLLDVVDSSYQAKTEYLLSAAETDYRTVLNLDPEMSFTHFNLGHLLVTAERYEEAETQFGLAAELGGNFIEANYNRGLIRILLGKISKGCEDMSLAGELGLTDSYNVIKRYCE